jgi:hypothetical protein
MPRQVLNFLIDAVTLALMLAMTATGLLLRFVLPPGSRGGQGLRLWNMTRHDWGDLHFWLALALLLIALVHVALHWTWVCTLLARWTTRTARPLAPSLARRTLAGVAVLALCGLAVSGFLWLGHAQTRPAPTDVGPQRGRGAGRSAETQLEPPNAGAAEPHGRHGPRPAPPRPA